MSSIIYSYEHSWFSTVPEEYHQRPEYAFFRGDPDLPDALLICDSISMSYTIGVRSRLAGRANLYRAANNCRSTRQILEEIEDYIGEIEWDLIHFNAGIHDFTWITPEGKTSSVGVGARQVSLEQYVRNMERIVERLNETGATILGNVDSGSRAYSMESQRGCSSVQQSRRRDHGRERNSDKRSLLSGRGSTHRVAASAERTLHRIRGGSTRRAGSPMYRRQTFRCQHRQLNGLGISAGSNHGFDDRSGTYETKPTG